LLSPQYSHPSAEKCATWRMPALLNPATVCSQRPMDTRDRYPGEPPDAAALQKELYLLEMYHRETGAPEFMYDVVLDVFRFPEDGRIAFCDEFADWKRLWERGYMPF
jgi:hypothetical protein